MTRTACEFPLEPLLEITRLTQSQFAKAVNAGGGAVSYAAEHGLTLSQADRWALRLNLHPTEVWTDWIDRGLAVAS